MWLVVHNKILTIDNLSKRQHLNDVTYLFLCEEETVNHLLCECIVAQNVWHVLAENFQFSAPNSIAELSSLWDRNN